jgi:8-oxo-dGTP diphosphatase
MIDVVCAVIPNRQRTAFLCGQRKRNSKWEFIGGKIEPNEHPRQALIREIQEEIGCHVNIGKQISTYTDNWFRLRTYYAFIQKGHPECRVHNKIEWINKEELNKLNWMTADIDTVSKILGGF